MPLLRFVFSMLTSTSPNIQIILIFTQHVKQTIICCVNSYLQNLILSIIIYLIFNFNKVFVRNVTPLLTLT